MPRFPVVTILALFALAVVAGSAEADPTRCATSWQLKSTDSFRGADALVRSQGVTTDGRGWFFSWLGGLQRTLDDYTPVAATPIAPQFVPSANPDGTNSIAETHIGDIDYYDGLIYAPEED